MQIVIQIPIRVSTPMRGYPLVTLTRSKIHWEAMHWSACTSWGDKQYMASKAHCFVFRVLCNVKMFLANLHVFTVWKYLPSPPMLGLPPSFYEAHMPLISSFSVSNPALFVSIQRCNGHKQTSVPFRPVFLLKQFAFVDGPQISAKSGDPRLCFMQSDLPVFRVSYRASYSGYLIKDFNWKRRMGHFWDNLLPSVTSCLILPDKNLVYLLDKNLVYFASKS